jgi:hypothetical protein
VRFGGKFWCLVEEVDSDEEDVSQITEPASSPTIVREVAETILEEGGWSEPICRRKRDCSPRDQRGGC